jgi:Gpi18-like mannosyltransferase
VAHRLTAFAGHWVTRVLAIFVLSRIVTTTIFLVVASLQQVSDRTGAHPDFFEFANIWDGQWYWYVNAAGYPNEIPRDENGVAQENAWAFMPAYPFLLRLITVWGVPFPAVAPFVSMIFAGAAALVFFRLMARFLPPGSALFATALFCTAPLSTILQVSYA